MGGGGAEAGGGRSARVTFYHELMVLITKATSEGSGEPAYPRGLARTFAVRKHKVWK